MPTKFDVQSYTNAWNSQDLDKITEFYAQNSELVVPGAADAVHGKEEIKRSNQAFLTAFPDIRGQPVWNAQENDKCAILARVTGTHRGEFEYAPGKKLPPSGKSFSIDMGIFLTLDASGKIQKEVDTYDLGTMMQQLGATPDVLRQMAGQKGQPTTPRRT